MLNALILWEASEYGKPSSEKANNASERLMKESSALSFGFAGQRARVPPDPIPNSEVKPCSVSSCSVVFGHVNLGKLAAHLNIYLLGDIWLNFITKRWLLWETWWFNERVDDN